MSTIHLIRGQRIALPGNCITVSVQAEGAVDVCAVLLTPEYRVRGDCDVVLWNQPEAPGVRLVSSVANTLEIHLANIDMAIDRLAVVIASDPAHELLATRRVTITLASDTGFRADYVLDALAGETAVVGVSIYRYPSGQNGAWKVQADGAGYDRGLAALLPTYGVEVADDIPHTASVAPTTAPTAPDALTHDATSLNMPTSPPVAGLSAADMQRAIDVVRMIWEDASRSLAGYLSSRDFAYSRYESELEVALSLRAAGRSDQFEATRVEAMKKRDSLLAEASQRLHADADHLAPELLDIQEKLPASATAWDHPQWLNWGVGKESVSAIVLGTVSVAELPQIRIPIVQQLPLNRALWISPDLSHYDLAVSWARSLTVRMVAAGPGKNTKIMIVDPLTGGNAAGLLRERSHLWPAAIPGSVAESETDIAMLIDSVSARAELLALSGQSVDDQLILLIFGFPHGWNAAAINQLAAISRFSDRCGVNIIIVGDQAPDPTLIPVLVDLEQTVTRWPLQSDAIVRDPFGGVNWVFEPDQEPPATFFTPTGLAGRVLVAGA